MRNVLSTCGVAGSFDLMLAYRVDWGRILNLEFPRRARGHCGQSLEV